MWLSYQYRFFHPILNVSVMPEAATATLPLGEKGEGNHSDLGPEITEQRK